MVAALGVAACAHAPDASGDRYAELFATLHPSIVLLTMQIPADDQKRRGQWDDAYGSGVIYDSGAWGSRIITDAHVVADARNLRATIGDRTTVPAHVVATSNDTDDVAIVAVATANQPVAAFGSLDRIVPGRAIGLIGYPVPDAFDDEKLGRTASLYAGRVASLRPGAIELDLPVIPGESGGPVFDATTGAVVGLAASSFDDERAIGFATPVDVVARFIAAHPRDRP